MEQKGRKGPFLVPVGRAAEADGCLLCPLVLMIACPLTTLLPWGLAMSPGGGAAVPLLAAEQSTVCSNPRGGQDRTDLQPFALSCPGDRENILGAPVFPPAEEFSSAQHGTAGPCKEWAQQQLGELCHLYPQAVV